MASKVFIDRAREMLRVELNLKILVLSAVNLKIGVDFT